MCYSQCKENPTLSDIFNKSHFPICLEITHNLSFLTETATNISRTVKNSEPVIKSKYTFISTPDTLLILVNIFFPVFVFYERKCQYGISLYIARNKPCVLPTQKQESVLFHLNYHPYIEDGFLGCNMALQPSRPHLPFSSLYEPQNSQSSISDT